MKIGVFYCTFFLPNVFQVAGNAAILTDRETNHFTSLYTGFQEVRQFIFEVPSLDCKTHNGLHQNITTVERCCICNLIFPCHDFVSLGAYFINFAPSISCIIHASVCILCQCRCNFSAVWKSNFHRVPQFITVTQHLNLVLS